MSDAGPMPDDPDGRRRTAADAPEESGRTSEIDAHHLRLLEAVLFAAPEPLAEETIADRLPDGAAVPRLLAALAEQYRHRGVNLVRAGGRWSFRTADDLGEELRVHMTVPRRLSRAAMETLAIVAYHQPVTRAEIEEIRGVGLSRGTLDALLEAGWVVPKGRRRTAGRPVTWGTAPKFLSDFGLESITDLPGLDDLKAAGLLDRRPAIQITDLQGAPEEGEEESDDDAEGAALALQFPDEDGDEDGESGVAGEGRAGDPDRRP
jgi:segregation and condensation protein B